MCRRCDLWRLGTQTVFGEGRTRGLMLVGEQPGDAEDLEGRPFVGPAGRLLRELLEEVGIDDDRVYVTNAVKHFKLASLGEAPAARQAELVGGAGVHALARSRACGRSPDAGPVSWRDRRASALRAERPGGTAAWPGPRARRRTLARVTIHPSAVLRAGDQRQERRAELLDDLTRAGEMIAKLARASQRSKTAKS